MSKFWLNGVGLSLLSASFFLCLTAIGQAAELSGRHIMIVHSGVDTLWGSALFMIKESEQGKPSEIPVLLPKETEDFQIQEGLEQQDLVLDKDLGRIVIRKTFAPGEYFIAIGFKVPASGGEGQLTLTPLQAVSELSVLTKPDSLQLSGDGFEAMLNTEMNGQRYDRLVRHDIAANSRLLIKAKGVPEGRRQLWALGAFAAIVLLASGAVLASRTRPNLGAGNGASDAIG